MMHPIQRNFLFLWILMLLSMALVLSLTFTGCSGNTVSAPVQGKATSALGNSAPVQAGCSDSDNGIDQSVKGIVTVGGTGYADKCVGPFLVEYYCEDGKMTSKNIRCECSKGQCVST